MKKGWTTVVFFGLLIGLASCKKETKQDADPDVEEPIEVLVKEDSIKDTIFYYTKLLSLWQDYMPPRNVNDILKSEVIRSYTKSYKTGEEVLAWMLGLTPIDPDTKKPIDRYSFLDRAGVISGEIYGAVAKSFGMYVFYLDDDLYVRMVDKNSPAYIAGVRRGDRILSINGNTKIDYPTQLKENFKTVNGYLNESTMLIKFGKPSGVIEEKQIANVQYNIDPILDSRVINFEGKKVGYLAFSSFVSIMEKNVFTRMHTDFENVFNSFDAEGINDLIVDLRYNGGGSVLTAEYLADHIAPLAADKQQMLYYEMNTVLSRDWEWTAEGEEFGPVKFAKKGKLNLPKVYFLVTRSTASASELLINSLKPYMQVHIIGTYVRNEKKEAVAQNTYGKPVGFFGIEVLDKNIELYVSSFKTFNKNKEGNYYNGLIPQHHVWEYSKFRDFGDPEEPMIAAALAHVKNGNFAAERTAQAALGVSNIRKPHANDRLQETGGLQGMFKYPKGKLIK